MRVRLRLGMSEVRAGIIGFSCPRMRARVKFVDLKIKFGDLGIDIGAAKIKAHHSMRNSHLSRGAFVAMVPELARYFGSEEPVDSADSFSGRNKVHMGGAQVYNCAYM